MFSFSLISFVPFMYKYLNIKIQSAQSFSDFKCDYLVCANQLGGSSLGKADCPSHISHCLPVLLCLGLRTYTHHSPLLPVNVLVIPVMKENMQQFSFGYGLPQ